MGFAVAVIGGLNSPTVFHTILLMSLLLLLLLLTIIIINNY